MPVVPSWREPVSAIESRSPQRLFGEGMRRTLAKRTWTVKVIWGGRNVAAGSFGKRQTGRESPRQTNLLSKSRDFLERRVSPAPRGLEQRLANPVGLGLAGRDRPPAGRHCAQDSIWGTLIAARCFQPDTAWHKFSFPSLPLNATTHCKRFNDCMDRCKQWHRKATMSNDQNTPFAGSSLAARTIFNHIKDFDRF